MDTPQTLGEEEFDPRIEYTVTVESEAWTSKTDITEADYNKKVNDQLLMLIKFLGVLLKDFAQRNEFRFMTSMMIAANYFKPEFL